MNTAYKIPMKFKIMLLSFVVVLGHQAGAFTQVEVTGLDAQVVMDAFNELGHTTSHMNPLTGSILGLAFAYKTGGFEVTCRIANPGIVSQGSCKISVNPERQETGLSTLKTDRLTVVTFSEAEVVQKISQGLPQNPWKSESKTSGGSERLNLACPDAGENGVKLCRLMIAD